MGRTITAHVHFSPDCLVDPAPQWVTASMPKSTLVISSKGNNSASGGQDEEHISWKRWGGNDKGGAATKDTPAVGQAFMLQYNPHMVIMRTTMSFDSYTNTKGANKDALYDHPSALLSKEVPIGDLDQLGTSESPIWPWDCVHESVVDTWGISPKYRVTLAVRQGAHHCLVDSQHDWDMLWSARIRQSFPLLRAHLILTPSESCAHGLTGSSEQVESKELSVPMAPHNHPTDKKSGSCSKKGKDPVPSSYEPKQHLASYTGLPVPHTESLASSVASLPPSERGDKVCPSGLNPVVPIDAVIEPPEQSYPDLSNLATRSSTGFGAEDSGQEVTTFQPKQKDERLSSPAPVVTANDSKSPDEAPATSNPSPTRSVSGDSGWIVEVQRPDVSTGLESSSAKQPEAEGQSQARCAEAVCPVHTTFIAPRSAPFGAPYGHCLSHVQQPASSATPVPDEDRDVEDYQSIA